MPDLDRLPKFQGTPLKKNFANWKMTWSSKKLFDGHFPALPIICRKNSGNISMMAKSATVRAKQRLYFAQGSIVTPMVQKTYWFDGQTPVQSIAQRFARSMPEWFDADLLSRTEALRRLPPAAKQASSHRQPGELNSEEQTALRGYAYCYRLFPSQA